MISAIRLTTDDPKSHRMSHSRRIVGELENHLFLFVCNLEYNITIKYNSKYNQIPYLNPISHHQQQEKKKKLNKKFTYIIYQSVAQSVLDCGIWVKTQGFHSCGWWHLHFTVAIYMANMVRALLLLLLCAHVGLFTMKGLGFL